MPDSAVISVLARSLLAGGPPVDEVHARAVRTLGRPWRWLRPLAQRYVENFGGGTRPRHRDVVRFLLEDEGFRRARAKYRGELSVAEWIAKPQPMQAVEAVRGWNLPAIESIGDLARWFSLTDGELEWFADLKGLSQGALEHYSYQILSKRSGGVRLLERPKPRLKELQRRILEEILNRIPTHHAVHGFVKARSIVTFARPHVGHRVLLRLDLLDFFATFLAARVQAFFRTLGYPEGVASRLAGICTNGPPRRLWKGQPRGMWTVYAHPHLPQGAPTSPALANLMAYRLDCRLLGLAKSAGAVYTRYADDLAFSGEESFERSVERFAAHVAAIALEEGFHINHHKTRMMRQGVRQQLAGIVVNQKTGLRRREVKLLEAILTNCVRFGPESQNRARHPDFRAHLEGRVAFVSMVDPRKGRRLAEILHAISWER
jgi:RNA-directed DNA polymerase